MEGYRTAATRLRHPVNIALHEHAPIGVRIANAVTGFMGSWRFIIIQTCVVALWVAGNIYLVFHFDPYPFIFLNLAFSTQAAYAAPLILLASNQSATRDRATLEHTASQEDIEVNRLAQMGKVVVDIHDRLDRMEAMLTELASSTR